MSRSKLGPIPDDHFENEPGPVDANYPGKASRSLVDRLAQRARILRRLVELGLKTKSK